MALETVDDPREAERAGRLLDAIDAYTDQNRRARDHVVEQRLVELRYEATALLADKPGRAPWPPEVDPRRFADVGLPEVRRGSITGDDIAAGVLGHGCLVVRGLLTPAQVETSIVAIDRSFAAYDAHPGGAAPGDDPWYRPLHIEGRELALTRKFVADHRGLWLGDSPPAMFELLEAFADAGVVAAIADYLGERPAMSLEKTTLRCTPPRDRITTWHQDGSFIDDGIRTINVWTALTSCGGDDLQTPALDIVPRRFDDVLPTGGNFAHAVPFETVEQLALDTPVIRPEFEAGDALLFDEVFLHRTGISPGMTRERYAIESWFFAPSCYPASYVPLVV